jgi:uncharacterized lipoprotein YmbA
LAALAIGTSFVLAGCAGNPPTEQYAVLRRARQEPGIQGFGKGVSVSVRQCSPTNHADSGATASENVG